MERTPENWPSKRVRDTFLKFFTDGEIKNRNEDGSVVLDEHNNPITTKLPHTYWPSSSVMPFKDPSILFVNSGMCQFKNKFTGNVQSGFKMTDLVRATNTQKCIRAGGKHNDLEVVGKDTYHHTFFEMLGSWSFGDYSKRIAIDMAWEILTERYGLNPERMYATYLVEGDMVDSEARELWQRYLPKERVVPGDSDENWWNMGDTGPCGPCTEIHYDLIDDDCDLPKGQTREKRVERVNGNDPTLIEIWNIVSMEYNRLVKDGECLPLPQKHIDTGLGFERLTAIMQGKKSNYDTDVFTPIFEAIQKEAPEGTPAYGGKFGAEDVGCIDQAYRVIADHSRAATVAIADGGTPGPKDSSYIIRIMIRRASRFADEYLKVAPDFLSTIVDVIINSLVEAFPDLKGKGETVKGVIRREELLFSKTLKKGKVFFDKKIVAMKASKESTFSGENAFYLYQTLGYPLEVTKNLCEAENLSLDEADFKERLMIAQEKSRGDRLKKKKKEGDELEVKIKIGVEATAFLKSSSIVFSDDSKKYLWDTNVRAKVLAIVTPESTLISDTLTDLEEGEIEVGLILDSTSFYAVAGGQVADKGRIVGLDDNQEVTFEFKVSTVVRHSDYIVHSGTISFGCITVDQSVRCEVDYDRRRLIAPNHTFTHVLNHALRQVLGKGVGQRGSEVDENKIRFDFSYGKAMTEDQIIKISKICQGVVSEGLEVSVAEGKFNVAEKIHGLRMEAGEQYPDNVRVVSIGAQVPELLKDPSNEKWYNYSIEFCGGTHLKNTKEAEAFELFAESSTSSGVRRLEARTKTAALESREKGARLLKMIEEAEKMPTEILKSVLSEIHSGMVDTLCPVPLPMRFELNRRYKILADNYAKKSKNRDSILLKSAKSKLIEGLNNVKEQGSNKLVLEMDIDGNQKMMTTIMKDKEIAEIAHGVSVMVISKTRDGKAVRFMAKSDMSDVDVEAWARQSCSEARIEGVKGSARGNRSFANGALKVKSGESSVVLSRMIEAAMKCDL